MSDKVHGLVKKLWHQASVWDLDVPEDRAEMERILRAELDPLLDSVDRALSIAFHAQGMCGSDCTVENCHFTRLAAELQNWTARNPDGR